MGSLSTLTVSWALCTALAVGLSLVSLPESSASVLLLSGVNGDTVLFFGCDRFLQSAEGYAAEIELRGTILLRPVDQDVARVLLWRRVGVIMDDCVVGCGLFGHTSQFACSQRYITLINTLRNVPSRVDRALTHLGRRGMIKKKGKESNGKEGCEHNSSHRGSGTRLSLLLLLIRGGSRI